MKDYTEIKYLYIHIITKKINNILQIAVSHH